MIFLINKDNSSLCGVMKGLGNLLEREIVSLFFLFTEFPNFNIQDQRQLKFPKRGSIVR